jgi:hypothetical protein
VAARLYQSPKIYFKILGIIICPVILVIILLIPRKVKKQIKEIETG